MNERKAEKNSAIRADEDGLTVSHRSFVNNWECDENDHWNVQFYSRAFQHASEALSIIHGGSNPGAASAVVRHIRYHRELRAADSIRISSARVGSGPFRGCIAHLMHDSQSGGLSATALDRPEYAVEHIRPVNENAIADALPRGLPADPFVPADSGAMLRDGRAIISNISIVRPFEIDHGGNLLANETVSRITDGAPHVWHHIGVTTDWLKQQGLGRVAVEMKLARMGRCGPGDAIRVVSWLAEVEGRTFVLHHQLETIGNDRIVAASEVRCLVMDLKTRKVARLPEFLAKSRETELKS